MVKVFISILIQIRGYLFSNLKLCVSLNKYSHDMMKIFVCEMHYENSNERSKYTFVWSLKVKYNILSYRMCDARVVRGDMNERYHIRMKGILEIIETWLRKT